MELWTITWYERRATTRRHSAQAFSETDADTLIRALASLGYPVTMHRTPNTLEELRQSEDTH